MITGMTLNQLAAECHANNAKWWHDLETGARLDRDKGELIMLVLSEIAEAMEGERKGLMDDKLPHRPMPEVELVDAIIRLGDFAGAFSYPLPEDTTIPFYSLPNNKGAALLKISKAITKVHDLCNNNCAPDMIGEQIRRALDLIKQYAQHWGYDLSGAYHEKTAFNKVRKDHTAEHRKGVGGKKW
ncbi:MULTISPECIES: hypothetical protein [unclassified Mesorhizobium]|uniref:hypothetical protein n=1 Tax=unclassified Mesorhizobium TaxID=325217 RepID=UPI00112935AD|nr:MULTISPECIES: hypothetical protein [unclassified Mesorhizobium]TPJ51650.1 hypothetical protein FJ426_20675 [Mesorhizobium sp. B2-6-4]TPN42328.1 hypothetical protein FJ979_01955 [Mesorhizobium sp. B1-1-6]